MFINDRIVERRMGFKKTSDIIMISFDITETVVNTFIEEEVSLTLDILNEEIFVVLAIDLDPNHPSNVVGLNTQTQMSLCVTSQDSVALLNNSNCLAEERINVVVDAAAPGASLIIRQSNGSTPPATLEWIGIIATNNFFIQFLGSNNTAVRGGTGRLWGYRAKADSSTYASLLQSTLLSS